MKKILFINLLLIFLCLPSCAQEEVAVFRETSCFLADCQGMDAFTFGYLSVPEVHNRPESKRLDMAVAILRSRSSQAKKDPLLYLSGGPGGESIRLARFWRNWFPREERDIIFVDFRGIGFSEPAFCPDLSGEILRLIAGDLTPHEAMLLRESIYQDCARQLDEDGLNLAAYHTRAVAADLELLRQVLGYEQWNLYGGSYGAFIAQVMMRDFPGNIRSAILDSGLPLNADPNADRQKHYERALRLFFDFCRKDPRLHQQYPELEKDFWILSAQLKTQPFEIVESTIPGLRGKGFSINFQDFHLLMNILLYQTSQLPRLPGFIEAFKQKDEIVVEGFTRQAVSVLDFINLAINLQIHKADSAPVNSTDSLSGVDEMPLSFFTTVPDLMQEWPGPFGTRKDSAPLKSDIPTLILSGEYDPVTPPEYGRQIQEHLSQAYFFEIPAKGHGVGAINASPCVQKIMSEFLDTPESKPAANCQK